MIRALVVGCGNIGADYDLHTTDVWTHAKAFSKASTITFSVVDRDATKAKAVANHYGVAYYTELTDELLRETDLVSICTPTNSHFSYLKQIAKFPNCYCICEKPVVSNLMDLALLKSETALGNRTLVNYIRRFQPGFQVLKDRMETILKNDSLSAIHIKYNRGLLNNGGHALDLIHFLFSKLATFHITKVQVNDYAFDAFKDDPTVVATALLNSTVPISFNGIKDAEYQIFEIELFLRSHVITITESGDLIRYFKTEHGALKEIEDWTQTNVMKDYMVPVLDYTLRILKGETKTNFTTALLINQIILEKFLNQIKWLN